MVIINDRTWYKASAIIGVCGHNFCSFVADTRRTTNVGGEYIPVDDSTQKIFKLNDNLMLGVTGLFDRDESILSAVESIADLQSATMESVLQAIIEFLNKRRFRMPKSRNYLIGGCNQDGELCITEVHMNFETFQPKVTNRLPDGRDECVAVSCALPEKAAVESQKYFDLAEQAVKNSSTMEELLGNIAGVIGVISGVDDSVGTSVIAMTVY